MRVSKLFAEKNGKPVISFEFFRAKNEKAAADLEKTLDLLAQTPHDYVSVTFGAGGSTRDGSFQLIDKLRNERKLDVVAYIAGIGLGPDDVTAVMDTFQEKGIETVFAIRGDDPADDAAFAAHPDAMPHASDLLSFIRSRYDFCLGAAGYPEGHIEAESLDQDIAYVKLKQDNGADYIVAQYFYDNKFYYQFVERCRAAGVHVPIVPGIMPIFTVKLMEILSSVCGSTITGEIREGLAKIPEGEKGGVARFGVELATRQCADLLKNGVPGLHFYTMNRGESVNAIVTNLRNQGLL